ncbi:hypothetical protein H2200_007001 [Cladophialophora chaetospira]|uniref:Heterokaryon incompatibility domain-containing protein n=1 Tax=Cladophialophora chaetospira TaxID=386627 RepID=A0AA38X9F7_9EURO|nr:hypothetical protein H2200_007001 [Cladophialophora chaetospira]
MAFSGQANAPDLEECPGLSHVIQLDDSRSEIRLLCLGDDIKLEKYQLLAAPPYYAVSYFWGPPTPTRPVRVHGELVAIRQSVFDLFGVLRERYGDKARFWIDLLCIDQHNLAERNEQVSVMNEVYSRATAVISWLGHSTPQSQSAFEIVRRELFCPTNAPLRLWGNSRQVRSFSGIAVKWPSTQQLEADHDLYRAFAEDIVWPALADILRRPYWDRLWVVPEMITATDCTLLCGMDAISLDKFVAVGDLWIRKGQQYQPGDAHSRAEIANASDFQDVINTWVPLSKISKNYREEYRQDAILLMEIVDNFAGKQCLNVRDKVFALRSLSKEAAQVKVDYSKTVLEVFLDLVQSGLLMSDGGRGFQSLPSFIWYMGLDYETLNEQLAELPGTVINLSGKLTGAVVTTRTLQHGWKATQLRPYYVRVVNKEKNQRTNFYRSSVEECARQFLHQAQQGDVLCTIPQPSPILLLLRPRRNRAAITTYFAVANLHSWTDKWKPSAELSSDACIIGEVEVSHATDFDRSQIQTFPIESCSMRGLTLWKNDRDINYTILV